MNRFRDPASLSPLRQAEAYWNALRQNGDVPLRSRLDPRGLGGLLEYAFVLEQVGPGLARFRLAGRHLNRLAGMDARGVPVSAFFAAPSRARLSEVLSRVFDSASVAELRLGSGVAGHDPLDARMILLPLRDDEGSVNRALGVLVADLSGEAKPRTLSISGVAYRPTGPVTAAEDLAKHPGFAETQPPFAPRARHLRVVK